MFGKEASARRRQRGTLHTEEAQETDHISAVVDTLFLTFFPTLRTAYTNYIVLLHCTVPVLWRPTYLGGGKKELGINWLGLSFLPCCWLKHVV